MTAVAAAAARAGWRGRIVWVALALSLTLNVFFVGGLVWSRMADRELGPLERFQAVGRQLDLDAEQQNAFQSFGRTVRAQGELLRERNVPLLNRVWEEVAKPEPDQALVAQLVEQAANNRQAYQKATAEALGAFMQSLRPEQRARFADIAKRRHDHTAHRIWRMILP